jgi:hypothetical protein
MLDVGSVSNLDQHISGSRRNRKSKGYPKIQFRNSNLQELSAVETKRLKEQVRRNIERFPEDFMFELTKEESLGDIP